MFASHTQLRDISLDPTYLATSLSSCDSFTRASAMVETVQRIHFPLPHFYKGQESFRLSFKSKEYKKKSLSAGRWQSVFFSQRGVCPNLVLDKKLKTRNTCREKTESLFLEYQMIYIQGQTFPQNQGATLFNYWFRNNILRG